MESKFPPKLSATEQQDITHSNSARDKFKAANAGLQCKLERMVEDAQDVFEREKASRTSTTAHSDLSDTVKFIKQETDGAMAHGLLVHRLGHVQAAFRGSHKGKSRDRGRRHTTGRKLPGVSRNRHFESQTRMYIL